MNFILKDKHPPNKNEGKDFSFKVRTQQLRTYYVQALDLTLKSEKFK